MDEFTLKSITFFIYNLALYWLGVRMAGLLQKEGVQSYIDSGSPRFFFYGFKELRFLNKYILTGRLSGFVEDSALRRIMGIYRGMYFLNFLLLLLIFSS